MNFLHVAKDGGFEVPEVSEGGRVDRKLLVRRGEGTRLLFPGEEVEILAAYGQSGVQKDRATKRKRKFGFKVEVRQRGNALEPPIASMVPCSFKPRWSPMPIILHVDMLSFLGKQKGIPGQCNGQKMSGGQEEYAGSKTEKTGTEKATTT